MMSTNSMSMGDRPSRRGRGAAADPVIDAVQREDLVNLNIRVPAELRKAIKMRATEDGELVQAWVIQAIEAKLDGGDR